MMRWLRRIFTRGPDIVVHGDRVMIHRAPKGFTLVLPSSGGSRVPEGSIEDALRPPERRGAR